ncbi:MAG: hypothetical protein QNJ63_19760 [Calothrix sp. MO_192.B10]|nr:hypothetical protein [Calothrix sp. MO_192.B10]
MSNHTHNQQSHVVKIVYAKQIINGRLELIPFHLYADGTLHRGE